ncbi:LytR/AlgR family response regulator transcription factor [Flammeovirga agarivorans]|uniref:Response regulator transcription factor n=1 Tax=Flammeovirga agarivorans TaxID=2726742 RepID=A0A7X8XYZ1_9BACT|nr:LytTR family DNA-binding domain-containing protein [Flammeovirga agarivorans]NLR94475.1 response regulator transcription factor [Flammeovirga agarivorans]
MRIVIIEDEYLMADELESLILDYSPEHTIEAKLTTIDETIEYFNHHPEPDLIFSDIQLADGLSFEIFQEIDSHAPVVFCTAYDEYALEAFKANGIDYILKPFDSDTITKTLDKIHRLTKTKSDNDTTFKQVMNDLSNKNQVTTKTNILIFKGDKIIPINTSDIALVQLENGVSYLYTFEEKKYATEQTLDALENDLGQDFYRVNRQFLINRKAIHHVSKYFARKLLVEVKLDTEEKIIVSKAKSSDFLRWLQA